MSDAMQLTALYDRSAPADLTISMVEIRDRGMIDVRGLTKDRKFMAAAKATLGTALPKKPRTSIVSGKFTCLWLSVDQWLIMCPLKDKDALLAKLNTAFDGVHAMVTDMSDARTVLRLKGAEVSHVLMKGGSIDFTQKMFTAGSVRRMTFADIPAMVHIVQGEPDTYDLLMFRSQAHHVWDWLALTARAGSNIGLPGNLETPQTV